MIRILQLSGLMESLGDSSLTILFLSLLLADLPQWFGIVAGVCMTLFWIARLKIMIERYFEGSVWRFFKSFFKRFKRNDDA